MCTNIKHSALLALRYYIGRFWFEWLSGMRIPTHSPLQSNEEDIEGLGLWKEEVKALYKVLKSHLSRVRACVRCHLGMLDPCIWIDIINQLSLSHEHPFNLLAIYIPMHPYHSKFANIHVLNIKHVVLVPCTLSIWHNGPNHPWTVCWTWHCQQTI